jgi:frataxin-like iron-binding protein CyaY
MKLLFLFILSLSSLTSNAAERLDLNIDHLDWAPEEFAKLYTDEGILYHFSWNYELGRSAVQDEFSKNFSNLYPTWKSAFERSTFDIVDYRPILMLELRSNSNIRFIRFNPYNERRLEILAKAQGLNFFVEDGKWLDTHENQEFWKLLVNEYHIDVVQVTDDELLVLRPEIFRTLTHEESLGIATKNLHKFGKIDEVMEALDCEILLVPKK